MVDKGASFSEEETDIVLNKNGKRPASSSSQEPEVKKKLRAKSLYRQPTVGEIARLNETEILFNSNLFRLQIEEILQEVKLNEKTHKKFNIWYAKFEKYLNDISVCETEYDLSENTLFKELKVKSPVPKSLSKTVCMFKFHKFKNLRIIGSYGLSCAIESKLVVDIEIQVPGEVYTKGDSVNYKYHKKRGAYLSCIAAHLNKCEIVEELQYFWLNGVLHCPYLEGKPAGKLGKYLSFRIHLTCSGDAYKLQRFAPARNNVRESWLFGTEAPDNELGPPTPHYNSSILSHLNFEANYDLLQQVFSNQENLKSAVILLKIWLRQRELKVSGFLIHMLVAHLVRLKRINNMMSSYQIIRNIWVSIESSKWDTEGISMFKGADSPPMTEFLQHFSVVFLDVTGYYNIAYEMSKGTYQALKMESALAVNMLDNRKGTNSFLPLFMKSLHDLEQFDHILRFKYTPKMLDTIYESSSKDKQINYGIDKLPLAIETVCSTFSEALGDRVFLIKEIVEADYRCPVHVKLEKSRKTSEFSEKISFGFVLNPDSAMNVLIKGPPANYPEADKFREFWGNKSEIRRFQDGTITEACVWKGESIAERRMLTKQILHFILENKFAIKPEETFYVADQFDSVLTRRQLVPADGIIGTGEELSLKVIMAFNELREDLRGLTGLPLEISGVYGVSPILSYSDPFPQIGQTKVTNPWQRGNTSLIKEIVRGNNLVCPDYTPVYEAVIKLTRSGKWPSNLEALQCLKTAFYYHISDRIAEQYSLLAQPYKHHVDIVKKGVVFRLRIVHKKEHSLLRQKVEAGVVKHRDTEESTTYYRELILLPKLRGYLHGLHQKHPAYGPTACLVKRFLSAHMIDDYHFSGTLVELLVAYIFVHPEPYAVPVQPLSGFLRVLRLLADTDWSNEMLLIDFNNDLAPEDKAEIERRFSQTPPAERPPMYIITSNEAQTFSNTPQPTSRSVWTQHGQTEESLGVCSAPPPSAPSVSRARALAARAVHTLTQHLNAPTYTDNVLGIFIPSAEQGFDVTIRLRADCAPHVNERVSAAPAPARESVNVEEWKVIPVVDFLPVRNYLNELRSCYGDYAVFLYDTYGGDVIGVIWKPDVDEIREFQIATANATMPVNISEEKERNKSKEEKNLKCTINKQAIIEDFKLLGEGLIKEVTVVERS